MCVEGGEWCVIVSTKVLRSALSDAASIAGLMPTTRVLVTKTGEDGEEKGPAVKGAVPYGAEGGPNSPVRQSAAFGGLKARSYPLQVMVSALSRGPPLVHPSAARISKWLAALAGACLLIACGGGASQRTPPPPPKPVLSGFTLALSEGMFVSDDVMITNACGQDLHDVNLRITCTGVRGDRETSSRYFGQWRIGERKKITLSISEDETVTDVQRIDVSGNCVEGRFDIYFVSDSW